MPHSYCTLQIIFQLWSERINMIADILLTIAAFGFTFSVLPQMTLLYKKKRSDEVSLFRNILLALCVSITIVAQILLCTSFAVVMNSIQLVLCIVLLVQIWYYRR